MYTKYSHYSDAELVSIAYGELRPNDELTFELLQRLETKVSEGSVGDDS
jgi:hypothetical protein